MGRSGSGGRRVREVLMCDHCRILEMRKSDILFLDMKQFEILHIYAYFLK